MASWIAILVASVARGAGAPDAADQARQWLVDTGQVEVEESLRLWYHVDLPLPSLRIVHLRVMRDGIEAGGWTCFAREDGLAGPWCDPSRSFVDVVAHYGLGTGHARLTDFDWLRFYQLSVGGACGSRVDLQRLQPGLSRRVLRLVPTPTVERSAEASGLQLTITCLEGATAVTHEVGVASDSTVTVERLPITP